MTPEGYRVVSDALDIRTGVHPDPMTMELAGQEDVRFVHIGPNVVNYTAGAEAWRVTNTLNRLASAGFLEQHGPRDAIANQSPIFKVLAIDQGIVYLEDTNSREY